MTLLPSQLPAMMLAVFVVAGLCGSAAFLSRFSRGNSTRGILDTVGCMWVILFALCATLATRAWLPGPWLERGCLLALAPGAWRSLRNLSFALREAPLWKSRLARWLTLVTAGVLFLDLLYAALPLYRYDQWTYHLVVAKWISEMGSLTPPVTYDHIFFTGSYEYLGLLARAVSSSDTFQQGFQNALSWLLVGVPAALMFKTGRNGGPYALVAALAFASLCIFGSGDHEALINAKPDYTLMMVAVLLLIFATGGEKMLHPAIAGFLITGGIGFKITWLHFASCAPFIAWAAIGADLRKAGPKLVAGGIAAVPCILPWAMKNWQFFRNPLHPAQSKLFTSSIWNPMLDDYWRTIAMKPATSNEWIANLFQAASSLPARWGFTGVIAAAILFLARRSPEGRNLPKLRWDGFFLSLLAYLTVWGSFYNAAIFNRFVASAFAFPLLIIWWWSRSLPLNARTSLLMLIPFLVHGQLEVTIPRLVRASAKPWVEFAENERGQLQKIPDLLAIANDRKQHFPEANYTQATLLSDYAFNYYGPSAFWIAGDPVTWWQLEHAGINPFDGDGREFLRRMDIRYVWVVDPTIFAKAPPALQRMIPELEPVPARIGKLYRVP